MITMNVNQSIQINASPKKVFAVLNDLHQWEAWSPWVLAEPTAKITVAKDGKYHEWEGEIIGAGNLKIDHEKENELIEMSLHFLKPWKSKAKTTFVLEKKGKGTLLTWKMNSRLPFFLFWMKKQMQTFVGMDYDRGLKLLKDLVETSQTNSTLTFHGKKPFKGTAYIGLKTSCSPQDMAENMERDFTDILKNIVEYCKDLANGDFLTIYHEFDVMKNKVVYTACFPVTKIIKELPERFVTGHIPDLNTYSIRHKGPYRHIANAWAAGMMHERGKKFKPNKKFPPIEVMRNSPKNTPENELVADILFPCN